MINTVNENNIKFDIITADGGIDYSDNYCNLEKKFFELFVS